MKDGRRFPEIACKCSGVFLEYCGVLQEWEAASVRGKRSLFARARRRWHSPLFANAKASNFIASNVYTMVCVCVSVWMHWNEKGSQRAAISQVYLQHHPTNRRILHPASIKNRSLTLPPAKTPSAPPARPNRSKHTVKPTLTAPPCDTLLFRTGVSAWCPCGYCQRPQSSLHLFLKKFLNYGLFYIQVGALQASGLRRISQTQHSTHTVYAVEREREQASVIHARTQKAKKPSLLL